MSIELLLEEPKSDRRAGLFIEPLAPLSLVTSMPGAYYRSQREPSKFMIYGMLENLLGWHFIDKERTPIINDLRACLKIFYRFEAQSVKDSLAIGPIYPSFCTVWRFFMVFIQSSLEVENAEGLLSDPAYLYRHEAFG